MSGRIRTVTLSSVVGAIGMIMTFGGAQANARPNLVVTYWQQATPLPETIIATQPALRNSIGANLHFRSITSGPAALAAMKSGAYSIVGGVGNTVVVAAIARRTNLRIVWAQYYDYAGLAVKKGIKIPSGLAGKTFGEQVGSSEAFSFYGWLKKRHLLGKVNLINLTPPAMLAAYKTGSISGGWVSQPWPTDMAASGGHIVATSAQMAGEGYPGINMVVVNSSVVTNHPKAVQAYVCALYKSTQLVKGSHSLAVLNNAGAYSGGKPNSLPVVKLGKNWPYWPLADEIGAKGLGTIGNPKSGLVANTLYKTGLWMEKQGTLNHPPSLSKIASYIDPKFAAYVVKGKCS